MLLVPQQYFTVELLKGSSSREYGSLLYVMSDCSHSSVIALQIHKKDLKVFERT